MASLCWNCDFVILFISILCILCLCIVSILLCVANGVIHDDYVHFEHVAGLIKKRKCKFTNYLVACRFDFEVLQLDFTELFAFAS